MALVRGGASSKEIVAAVRQDRELTNAVHAVKLAVTPLISTSTKVQEQSDQGMK